MDFLLFRTFFAIIWINVALTENRGILSSVWGGNKPPIEPIDENLIGPENVDDGCERTIPLTPPNAQQLELAFKRTKFVPDILPVAPENLLEVNSIQTILCYSFCGKYG